MINDDNIIEIISISFTFLALIIFQSHKDYQPFCLNTSASSKVQQL